MPMQAPAPEREPGAPAAKAGPAVMLAVGLVAGLAVGYMARSLLDSGQGPGQTDVRNTAEESELPLPAELAELTSLTGTVSSLSEEGFVLELTSVSPNALEDEDIPRTRTVLLTDATVFSALIPKDLETLNAEITTFEAGGAEGEPPDPFYTRPAGRDFLTEGASVIVNADHDILREERFTATEVSVNGDTEPPETALDDPPPPLDEGQEEEPTEPPPPVEVVEPPQTPAGDAE